MRFDFFTPQIFDFLIYANLAVGLLLIIGRFTMDMRRKPPVQKQSQQSDDESSYSHLSDTDANLNLAQNDTQKTSQRSK